MNFIGKGRFVPSLDCLCSKPVASRGLHVRFPSRPQKHLAFQLVPKLHVRNMKHGPSSGPSPRFKTAYAKKNQDLLMYTSAIIILAGGLSYAAVPLYRAFCAATGYAGTPMTSGGKFDPERLVPVTESRRIKVIFNADTSEALPWKFTPLQKYVQVLPGETSLAFYRAKNNSPHDIIGIATYNVLPDKVAPYFAKVECFCFEEQKLLAGEEVDLPLFFFIDKDFADDPAMRGISEVVLSYTFFKARRNARGHLEPDASEDVVSASQGFTAYPSHAPTTNSSSTNTHP